MRYTFLRLFAAALATLGLAAAPALATPATVRIAGEKTGDTTVVNTTSAPVPGNGCPGSSAAGALELATAGNWDHQIYLQTILGETHDYAQSDYWSFWVNGSYSQVGICDYRVQPGDQLLFFVQRDGPGFVGTVFPLSFASIPPAVTAGQPFTVRVMRHASDGMTTTPTPIAGATVTDGSGMTATTGADGTATVVLSTPGTARLQATAPSSVPTPPTTVAVSAGPVPVVDRDTPVALIAGVRNGRHFAHRHGPRKLRGTASAQRGVQAVEVRLKRKRGRRCSAFSAPRERFVKRSCQRGARWFDVGADASWSYLLPKRLGHGLYQLQVRMTDLAGTRSDTTSVRFRVR